MERASRGRIALPTAGWVAAFLTIVGGWAAWRTRSVNYGDLAMIELHTRDVFSRHPPLVGAFSRWDWAHPGPLSEQLMAVPYRLGGMSSTALRAATVALSVVWMMVLAWLVRRADPVARAAVGIAAMGVLATRGGFLAGDVWNPSVGVVALLVTLVAGWRAMERDPPGAGWVMLLAGSFCVQAHLGYLAIVAPVWLVVGADRRRSRPVHRRPAARTLRWGGVALAAAWSMPVLDSLVHPPGNLYRVARFLWRGAPGESRAGIAVGVRAALRASSLSWPWRANQSTVLATFDVGVGVLPGALLLVLVAARLTIARSDRTARRPLDLALGSWIGCVIGASGIIGLHYTYLTYWFHAVVWFSWFAAVTAVSRWLMARSTVRWLAPTAAIAAGCLQVVLAAVVGRGMLTARPVPPGVAAMVVDAADIVRTDAAGSVVALRADGRGFIANDVTAGVFNLLDRDGADVRWPDMPALVGARRASAEAVTGRYSFVDGDLPAPAGTELLRCWRVRSGARTQPGPDTVCLYRRRSA